MVSMNSWRALMITSVHQTTAAPLHVTVDNTPPAVTLDLPGGAYVRPEDDVVLIRGTADDNLAGVRRVKLSINDQPWRAVTLDDPGATSTDWSYEWPVGENAQGRHSLLVRAVDRAGNESEPQALELIVDQMAPTDELTDRTYLYEPPAVAVGQPHILIGVANESGRLPRPFAPTRARQRDGRLYRHDGLARSGQHRRQRSRNQRHMARRLRQ